MGGRGLRSRLGDVHAPSGILATQEQPQVIMEKIEAFRASDGTLWENKDKAERHELFLQKDMIVEEFLDNDINPYKALAQRSIARTTIINWELWKNKNAE
jgi:hypothetical protein